jgi:hypothetical protein
VQDAWLAAAINTIQENAIGINTSTLRLGSPYSLVLKQVTSFKALTVSVPQQDELLLLVEPLIISEYVDYAALPTILTR